MTTITYCGVRMTVDYRYIPAEGDNWNSPRIEAHTELQRVLIGGQDCTELLDAHLAKIEALAVEADQAEADEAAIQRYRERLEHA